MVSAGIKLHSLSILIEGQNEVPRFKWNLLMPTYITQIFMSIRCTDNRENSTHLSEVTRVILVHQYAVMMLTTGITTTTRMGSVLSNTAVSSGNVASLLAVVVKSGRLRNA
jgi:hypothetical protein